MIDEYFSFPFVSFLLIIGIRTMIILQDFVRKKKKKKYCLPIGIPIFHFDACLMPNKLINIVKYLSIIIDGE